MTVRRLNSLDPGAAQMRSATSFWNMSAIGVRPNANAPLLSGIWRIHLRRSGVDMANGKFPMMRHSDASVQSCVPLKKLQPSLLTKKKKSNTYSLLRACFFEKLALIDVEDVAIDGNHLRLALHGFMQHLHRRHEPLILLNYLKHFNCVEFVSLVDLECTIRFLQPA